MVHPYIRKVKEEISEAMLAEGEKVQERLDSTSLCPGETQEELLLSLLKENANTRIGQKYDFASISSVKEYREKVPVTDYEDYRGYINDMLENGGEDVLFAGRPVCFFGTSGGSGKNKQFPCSERNERLFERIAFSFVNSVIAKKYGNIWPDGYTILFTSYGRVKKKNGIPMLMASAIRIYNSKKLAHYISPSPWQIIFPEERIDTIYLHTLFAMQRDDVVEFSSTYSSMLYDFMVCIKDKWQMLVEDIRVGRINDAITMSGGLRTLLNRQLKANPERSRYLRDLFEKGADNVTMRDIWPGIVCIDCATTGDFERYLELTKDFRGDISVYHRGLTASEGLFSAPVELDTKDALLLLDSAFYEFIPMDEEDGAGKKPLLIHELKEGKEYDLVVTTLSGLYRYRMNDVVKVTGFYNKCPYIEFVHRNWEQLNVEAERTDVNAVINSVEDAANATDSVITGYSAREDVVPGRIPKYVFFVEAKECSDRTAFCEHLAESLTEKNEYLGAKIKAGRIGKPEVRFLKEGTYRRYSQMLVDNGVLGESQIKPPIILKDEDKIRFFESNVL